MRTTDDDDLKIFYLLKCKAELPTLPLFCASTSLVYK